jgi:hypothetical protein
MAMVHSPAIIFEMLDKLIQQTEFGNAKWERTDRAHEWAFQGTNALVKLTSVDSDGDFPIRLSIHDERGRQLNAWIVQYYSEPNEEEFDSRVRTLWALVSSANDRILSLIRDLDNMPPF